MLRALLVDDEKNICTLLKNLIDWNDYGIQIIGETYDGLTAFDMVMDTRPDILITDIKLPGMSGLDLIQKIHDTGLDIFIILISGHKKFEYAHTAIKYQVENYLLKPISQQELIDNLLNIRKKIEQQREDSDNRNLISITRKKQRHQFMALLPGSSQLFDGKDLNYFNDNYSFHLFPGSLCVMVIREDFKYVIPQAQTEIIENKLIEITRETLQPFCHDLEGIGNNGSCLFFLNYSCSQSELIPHFREILQCAGSYCERYCDLTIALGKESGSYSSDLVSTAYDSVRMRLLSGLNTVYTFADTVHGMPFSLTASDLDLLKTDIEILDTKKIELDMMNLGFRNHLPSANPLSVMEEGSRILQMLTDTMKKMYGNLQIRVLPEEMVVIKNPPEKSSSLQGYWNALTAVLVDSIGSYQVYYDNREQKFLQLAKNYIHEHYASNISLDDVAAEVYMSPAYFSALFKKEEGVTFIKYLINYRLSIAKALLKDPKYSINEISSQVGYSDTRYFTKLFKKEVGIKPSDYRKLYL